MIQKKKYEFFSPKKISKARNLDNSKLLKMETKNSIILQIPEMWIIQ